MFRVPAALSGVLSVQYLCRVDAELKAVEIWLGVMVVICNATDCMPQRCR